MKTFYIIIAFFLAFIFQMGFVYFSPYSLSPDETHYWLWSKYPDYCYYSKGPMLALLINASTSIFGDSVLAIKLPALLCFHIFAALFYFFVCELSSKSIALNAWLFLQITPIFIQSGVLMTSDAPVILFWLMATISAYRAIVQNRDWHWLFVGLALGMAVWAKYTAVLLAGALFLYPLLFKRTNSFLHYLGGLFLFSICLIPILLWNYENDWLNFLHNSSHLYKSNKSTFNPGYFFELLGAQFGLVGPVFLPLLFVVLAKQFRKITQPGIESLFFFSILPLLVVIILTSFTKRIYANWPLPLYLGLVLLAVVTIPTKLSFGNSRLIKIGFCLNVFLSALAYSLYAGVTFGVPKQYLPIKKLIGWEELATRVEKARNKLPSNIVLAADYYGTASSLSYHLKGRPWVYLFTNNSRRLNQYDIWQKEEIWKKLRGRDFLFATEDYSDLQSMKTYFEHLDLVDVFDFSGELNLNLAKPEYSHGGKKLKVYYLMYGTEFKGYKAKGTQNNY